MLLAQLVGLLGIDPVEDVERLRIGQRLDPVAEPGTEVGGLGGDLLEERGVTSSKNAASASPLRRR